LKFDVSHYIMGAPCFFVPFEESAGGEGSPEILDGYANTARSRDLVARIRENHALRG
jgi:hypothetical protein